MRAIAVLFLLTATALAGCASSPDNTPDDAAEDGAGPLDLSHLSEAVFDILPVEEAWIDMDDGKGMHTAVYRPDTNDSVPVFINFSPYWGDTAELRGDAFAQYMIDEYVPRGYAVVLAAIRGTGHSEGCFQIGGNRELQDMHDVVDFFANEDWSNGAIATGGKSYDSSPTNGLIAKYPHPALKGVFHVSGITDMYGYNYKGGVPYATGPVFNTYYYLQGTDEYGVSLVGAGGTDNEDSESLARVIDDAACTELPQMQASGVGSGVHGLKDDYWIERDWNRYIGDSDWNGSIFFVHGLQDWNVKPDHILPWIDKLPEQIRTKGWLHQGGHVYPERTDWNETMLRWMDHELKGIDTGFWEEPRWEAESSNGTWFQHEDWPPAPVQVGGGNAHVGGFEWSTKVSNQSMHISGQVVLNATFSSNTPDPVVGFTVYDEAPNGERTWLSEGFVRGIYRNGLDWPEPVVPESPFEASIACYPFDHVVPPGHTLVVAAPTAPSYALTAPPQTDGVVLAGSYDLSVTWAEATQNAPQPKAMECFAC